MRIYIILLSFLVFSFNGALLAQEPEPLIQLSGIVADADLKEPLPYVTIYAKNTTRGTISANNGFFSLVVMPGDTVMFSTVGYKRQAYIVPDTLRRSKESIFVSMIRDTVELEEAIVYPWPTREQFREEFLAMEVQVNKDREHFESMGFRYLDTIYPVPPSPLWNPASFIYENVYQKIKERVPKKKRARQLPKFE